MADAGQQFATQPRYVIYQSWQDYRGKTRPRVRVKRLQLPATAYGVSFEGPGQFVKRSGAVAYGILVRYHHMVSAASVVRRGTHYVLPARDIAYRKVVELDQPAANVRLRDQPPADVRLLMA